MDEKPRIADGQEAVFRYGEHQSGAKSSNFGNPRLLCILVCPVILIMVLLAVSENSIWVSSLDRGLHKAEVADQSLLHAYNESSTVIIRTMVHNLQHVSAEAAVTQIHVYTSLPELVVNLNVEEFHDLPLSESEVIDETLRTMWKQTTQLFPEVGCIFYANEEGLYVGYERLPKSFLKMRNVSYTFGAEFRASDTTPMPVCSYCPPVSVLRPGEKTYYFVDSEGKYAEAYERHEYDPRKRPWYRKAVAAKGNMTWMDIYNHSSGNSMGTSAQRAIMKNSKVTGVAAGDFTVNLLSYFMQDVTSVIEFEEGFIIDAKSGLMVASSRGMSQVARPVSPQDNEGLVRFHWKQVPDCLVESTIRTLLQKYGSLKAALAPEQGGSTLATTDGRFIFTFTGNLQPTFQEAHGWLVVVAAPLSTYMHESWRQQAWAEKTSTLLHKELADNVDKHQIKTIWVCALFSLLGGLFMVCVGFAITRPLKRISTDMLSMAKLEFLSAQAEIIIDRDGVDERSAHRTRFLSEHLKKLFSDLAQRTRTRRFSKNSDDSAGFTDGEQCSSHSGSEETVRSRHGHSRRGVGSGQSTETNRTNRGYDRDGRDGHDCEDLEAPSRSCFRFSTPKEVLDMRESYVYMVTGLKSFARYLDPEIMRILVKSKRQAQLGMGRADVTIFFSDIANFTTMAEQLEPETFMSLLTEYLDEMSKIIMAKRGVVGEFIGDAIMAWWNVPIDLGQEHTAMALDAALCQQLRLQELRDVWEAKSLPEVRVRMGLVRGTVLAGNIGSSQRMKYGLVGDSVNLASRLEGLCKYYGVSVIIEQEAAFAPAVQNRFHLRLLDLVTVKGRTQATELYQLLAEKGDLPDEFDAEEDLQYFIGGFAEIHRLYRSKNFGACAEALKQYRRQFPQDTPSKMLLRRVETLLNEGLPADWDAVHRLTEK